MQPRRERTAEAERALALGAGAGLLLARVMQFDIGLGLVIGALAGMAWGILLLRGKEDDTAPRD